MLAHTRQRVAIPAAFKRPRMYIGYGGCWELHWITVGYFLSQATNPGGKLSGAYYEAVRRTYAPSSDTIALERSLTALSSDSDIASFIDMVVKLIDEYNSSLPDEPGEP